MSSSSDSRPNQLEDPPVGDRAGGSIGCPHQDLTHPLAQGDLWGQTAELGSKLDIPHHSDLTVLIFTKGHLLQLCEGYERISWLHGVWVLWGHCLKASYAVKEFKLVLEVEKTLD